MKTEQIKEIEAEFDEKFSSTSVTFEKDGCIEHSFSGKELKSFLLKTASEMYEKGREDVIAQITGLAVECEKTRVIPEQVTRIINLIQKQNE